MLGCIISVNKKWHNDEDEYENFCNKFEED